MPWALLLNRYVIGAAAFALLVGGAYVKGRMDGGDLAEIRNLKAERAILASRLDLLSDITEADAKRAAEDAKTIEDLRSRADETPPNPNACFDRDASGRVRAIR